MDPVVRNLPWRRENTAAPAPIDVAASARKNGSVLRSGAVTGELSPRRHRTPPSCPHTRHEIIPAARPHTRRRIHSSRRAHSETATGKGVADGTGGSSTQAPRGAAAGRHAAGSGLIRRRSFIKVAARGFPRLAPGCGGGAGEDPPPPAPADVQAPSPDGDEAGRVGDDYEADVFGAGLRGVG